MRTLICLSFLLLATSPALAGQVYKWKDANGVTQYSENPPPGKKFETRQITGDPGSRVPASAAPAETPVAPQCATARANLALLDGSGAVMQDTDGDGKADSPLDDTQRQNQRALAEAAAKAYCPQA
ncbi:DUF4124 domain-containing protein [Stenotrophomonas sp. 169]|uniref:DUF4124 domain-containing protein n=1 Tax=unclassified Stenotrophomonas TaxID=196198 RepID=UPI0016621D49|nr:MULTISPECIES: DUF4124 domain-containing protein [unclassified Stenotrophomonas]MBD8635941.1 DUF4124 domain-containing protein [Stenotrophomonas sp. CFBP 13725]MBD8697868.1 DUF4124 domain-containing protein [Stenotrophomonas sp. CFBP 13718]QNR97832.1 DUF4124 domain-containing protein [Stenotrophomonas sp. 169]